MDAGKETGSHKTEVAKKHISELHVQIRKKKLVKPVIVENRTLQSTLAPLSTAGLSNGKKT